MKIKAEDNQNLLIKKIKKIVDKGYVKSHRKGDTGIGKTFEDLMGITENNIPAFDLHGYEIKCQRSSSNSYITLFTKSPSYPIGANSILKDKFGEPYEDNPSLNKLHTSMFANKKNSYLNRLSFKLVDCREEKKVYIQVSELSSGKILSQEVYYTYEDLQHILNTKLKQLCLVLADIAKRDKDEYFNYKDIYLFHNPTLASFLNLLNQGKIMYDIRIGSYKSGKSKGKLHDHGSGFRIKKTDINLLYEETIKIDETSNNIDS